MGPQSGRRFLRNENVSVIASLLSSPFVIPKTSVEQLQVDMVALWLGGGSVPLTKGD